MDRPLSDYYINSACRSHLAYELVPSLKEPTRGYMYLLSKGVRHIDITCVVRNNLSIYYSDLIEWLIYSSDYLLEKDGSSGEPTVS